ncbi:MAG: hypothetical protein IPK26_08935 [Planctomycetes bacterium]|nr:hypothetical protein [Planctomycetota bacterium]
MVLLRSFAALAAAALGAFATAQELRLDLRLAAEASVAIARHAQPSAVALLVAPTERLIPLGQEWILGDSVIVAVDFAPPTEREFAFPIGEEAVSRLGARVQAVALDSQGVFVASTVLVPGQLPPAGEVQAPLANVRLSLAILETVPPRTQLMVEFTAPTDGYALRAASVVRSGNATDVYVLLKTPGPGEGNLDVVEEHSLALDLGSDAGAFVRVHGATSPAVVMPPMWKFVRLEELVVPMQ